MYPLFLIPFFRHGITGCIPHPAFCTLLSFPSSRRKGQPMKIKKTPQDKRGTYKLFDDNGNFVTEYKPGEHGIKDVDILALHTHRWFATVFLTSSLPDTVWNRLPICFGTKSSKRGFPPSAIPPMLPWACACPAARRSSPA